jgi:DNA-binding transcriptional ArsR family regulator
MVEYTLNLDTIFGSLADTTRRDILRRLMRCELSVSEIAEPYTLTLAAISKHLKILEKAHLVVKHRQGKQRIVALSPVALKDASDYLRHYERIWNDRFDAIETLLNKEE